MPPYKLRPFPAPPPVTVASAHPVPKELTAARATSDRAAHGPAPAVGAQAPRPAGELGDERRGDAEPTLTSQGRWVARRQRDQQDGGRDRTDGCAAWSRCARAHGFSTRKRAKLLRSRLRKFGTTLALALHCLDAISLE